MPIYEYQCDSCDKVIEVIQRMSEKPLSHCPDCQGEVTKLVSKSAFHLKGGGWFADGYSNNSNSESKSSGNGNGKAAKAEKKTEDKKSTAKTEGKTKKSTDTCVKAAAG